MTRSFFKQLPGALMSVDYSVNEVLVLWPVMLRYGGNMNFYQNYTKSGGRSGDLCRCEFFAV